MLSISFKIRFFDRPNRKKFEKKLCNYTKSKNAVAANSASTGLIIACQALDLKNDYLNGRHLSLLYIQLIVRLFSGKS